MDADELALFTGAADAERSESLREQLWLLTSVREEVQLHARVLRTSVTDNPGYGWRSAAERGYAERVRELGGALDHAIGELDAAAEAVRDWLARRG